MKLQDVQNLLDKGFTHDEIMSFINAEEKPEVKPEEKPEVKPEEKPEVKPEEKPEVKPEEKRDPVVERLEKLENMFSGVLAEMQKSNIINSVVKSIPGTDAESVDNILAGLIRPERKEK